jgi:SRSO17 transposase
VCGHSVGQTGLDQYQLRQWTCWHRFTTLAMLALAFLAVCTAPSAPPSPEDPSRHGEPGTAIPLRTALAA